MQVNLADLMESVKSVNCHISMEFKSLKTHMTNETDRILTEMRKFRKAVAGTVKETNSVPVMTPIVHEGVNLCDICPSGSVTQVALALARHLFSDMELSSTQLLKKSTKGRPSASPERTRLLTSELCLCIFACQ